MVPDILLCGEDYACQVNVHISQQLNDLLALTTQVDLAIKSLLVATLAVIAIVAAWKVLSSMF